MLGMLTPPRLAGPLGQEPHYSGMKPGAPVSPALAVVPPSPVFCVDRKKVGVALDGREQLNSSELIGAFQPRPERLSIDLSWFGHSTKSIFMIMMRYDWGPRLRGKDRDRKE